MEIYLVRHTTPKIAKGICYGQADIPLLDSFPSELKKVQALLSLDEPHTAKVFTSPLKRCLQLTKTLFSEYTEDSRLKELNFGNWELQPWNAIDKKDLDVWMSSFVNTAPPNGESYLDLAKRSLEVLEEITSKSYKKVIIITHAGVIRALLANILDIPLEDSFDITVPYGHVIKLKQENNLIKIVSGLMMKDL